MGGMSSGMGGGSGVGMQNMLAQQNREMEALERRGRARSGSLAGPPGGVPPGAGGMAGPGQQPPQQRNQAGPRADDDDSAGAYSTSYLIYARPLTRSHR